MGVGGHSTGPILKLSFSDQERFRYNPDSGDTEEFVANKEKRGFKRMVANDQYYEVFLDHFPIREADQQW